MATHRLALFALTLTVGCVGAHQATAANGSHASPTASRIAAAQTALTEMLRVDQAIQFDPVLNPLDALHNSRIDETFAKNVPVFEAILNEFGWPRSSLFGNEAAKAAFLVAQHADAFPEFQKRCLELLSRSVAENEALPRHWALLTDRVLKNEGKPQRFGTQWADEQLWPIDEPDQVDRRRAEVGLDSLEQERAEHQAMIEQLRATYHLK